MFGEEGCEMQMYFERMYGQDRGGLKVEWLDCDWIIINL